MSDKQDGKKLRKPQTAEGVAFRNSPVVLANGREVDGRWLLIMAFTQMRLIIDYERTEQEMKDAISQYVYDQLYAHTLDSDVEEIIYQYWENEEILTNLKIFNSEV